MNPSFVLLKCMHGWSGVSIELVGHEAMIGHDGMGGFSLDRRRADFQLCISGQCPLLGRYSLQTN
jgi:hypothetical protein